MHAKCGRRDYKYPLSNDRVMSTIIHLRRDVETVVTSRMVFPDVEGSFPRETPLNHHLTVTTQHF